MIDRIQDLNDSLESFDGKLCEQIRTVRAFIDAEQWRAARTAIREANLRINALHLALNDIDKSITDENLA